jgi:hypothetical protein
MAPKRCIIFSICEKNTGIVRSVSMSSADYFAVRTRHIYYCGRPSMVAYNSPLYRFIRAQGGFDEFEFNVLEMVLTPNYTDQLKRKAHYTNLYSDTIISTELQLAYFGIKEKNT